MRSVIAIPAMRKSVLACFVLVVAAAALGCKSKEQKCLESCEKAFKVHTELCTSPTLPNPEQCPSLAKESRWQCRRECGVNEPNPVPTTVASVAPPALPPPEKPRIASEYELASLCSGKPVPGAAAYRPSKGAHNAALVASLTLGADSYTANTLTDDYKTLGPQGDAGTRQSADAYSLVVCVSVKDHKKVKECKFPTHALELHDATFEIRVLEASTGRELKNEVVAVPHGLKQCPTVWNFYSERDISLPLYAPAVLKVAKPFVDPS